MSHSALTFSKPRKRNCLNPRASFIWPNTGSTTCLRLAAKPEHLHKQTRQCLQVSPPELADRIMVGILVGRDDPKGYILTFGALYI